MRILSLLFIILSLIIVACEKEATPAPTISPMGSPTVQAPSTLPVSETPTSFHPTPSVTPTPIQTEPESPFAHETILMPVIPSSPANSYRLKDWTVEERLALIEEARIEVYQLIENWPLDSYYRDNDLIIPLIMMEREALFLYPNMESYNEVAWDLAYWESLNPDHRYTVERLASILAEGLNSGEITLDSITSKLASRGFSVTVRFESDNLFDNTRSGTVLQIEVPMPYYSIKSLTLIAIGKLNGGDFRVVPVNPFWYWNVRREDTISLVDTNKNHTTEVMVDTYRWASGIPGGCQRELSLNEWQGPFPGGQFEDIAATISEVSMSTAVGACERPWEFEEEGMNGVPAIKAVRRYYIPGSIHIPGGVDDCPRYEKWTLYEWNEQIFEWANDGFNSLELDGPSKCTIGWANLAGGLNDEAVSLLETALLDWPTELDDIWGPASEDYFHFKLGAWYALRGEKELATNTLQSVRDNPENPNFGKASELAAMYLVNYESSDVTAACNAILVHLNEVAPRWECCSFDAETMLETWGFANPQWGQDYNLRDVCELEPSTANTEPPETEPWPYAQQEQAIAQIERTLFDDGNFGQARVALLDLLDTNLIGPENGTEVRTYLRFLLALTYELSGDENTAVDLYWQLWNEFPDSPYTVVIRHKLELIE